jgi:transcriptional regulator with XRE-family HTH domain
MANEMLGLYIRKMRQARGLTQELAARRAGVSLRHWAALEKGRNVTVDVLASVMGALDLSEAPIGPRAGVTRAESRLDTNAILAAVQAIAGQLEVLRDLAVTAALPRSGGPLRDTAAVEAFVARHSELSDDDARRLERTTRRLGSGRRARPARPQPRMKEEPSAARRRRTR